jgi:hypothetical protein
MKRPRIKNETSPMLWKREIWKTETSYSKSKLAAVEQMVSRKTRATQTTKTRGLQMPSIITNTEKLIGFWATEAVV